MDPETMFIGSVVLVVVSFFLWLVGAICCRVGTTLRRRNEMIDRQLCHSRGVVGGTPTSKTPTVDDILRAKRQMAKAAREGALNRGEMERYWRLEAQGIPDRFFHYTTTADSDDLTEGEED